MVLKIVLLTVPCFCTSSPLMTTVPQTQPGELFMWAPLTDWSDFRAHIADLLVGLFGPSSECALEMLIVS